MEGRGGGLLFIPDNQRISILPVKGVASSTEEGFDLSGKSFTVTRGSNVFPKLIGQIP